MRLAAALAVVLLAQAAARAAPDGTVPPLAASPVAAPPAALSPDARLLRRYRAARLRRDIGWGLSGLGLASLTAGAVLVGTALTESCNPSCYDTIILPRFLAGASLLAVGLAASIPGLVLALQGQGEMTEVRWRLGPGGPLAPIHRSGPAAFIVPRPGGVMIGALVRF